MATINAPRALCATIVTDNDQGVYHRWGPFQIFTTSVNAPKAPTLGTVTDDDLLLSYIAIASTWINNTTTSAHLRHEEMERSM